MTLPSCTMVYHLVMDIECLLGMDMECLLDRDRDKEDIVLEVETKRILWIEVETKRIL